MANRRGDTLGQEGRYRRTASPQTGKKAASSSAALLSQMAELSRQQVQLSQLATVSSPPQAATASDPARELMPTAAISGKYRYDVIQCSIYVPLATASLILSSNGRLSRPIRPGRRWRKFFPPLLSASSPL